MAKKKSQQRKPLAHTSTPPSTQPAQAIAGGGVQISHHEAFSGPLPHPGHLAQYEQVHPGLADRIVKLVEREQEAQHEMQGNVVEHHEIEIRGDQRLRTMGMVLAAVVALAWMVAVAVLTLEGHDTVGGVLGGMEIVSLTSAFIVPRLRRSDKPNGQDGPKAE